MCGFVLSEIYDNLLSFPHIEGQIISAALHDQITHLIPVGSFVIAVKESYHSSIVCKFHDTVSGMFCNTVIGIQTI